MTANGGVGSPLHVQAGEFKEIEFKRKALKFSAEATEEEHTYYIYKSAKEVEQVKAVSAKEALQKIGLKTAFRVVRADMVRKSVVEKGALIEETPPGAAEEKVENPQASAKNPA
jgi:hypothetical protein